VTDDPIHKDSLAAWRDLQKRGGLELHAYKGTLVSKNN
jgi:hypothetical protein